MYLIDYLILKELNLRTIIDFVLSWPLLSYVLNKLEQMIDEECEKDNKNRNEFF